MLPLLLAGAIAFYLYSQSKKKAAPNPVKSQLGGSALKGVARTANELAQGNFTNFLPAKYGQATTEVINLAQSKEGEQIAGAFAGFGKGIASFGASGKDLGVDSTGKQTQLNPQSYADQTDARLMQESQLSQLAETYPDAGGSSTLSSDSSLPGSSMSDLGYDTGYSKTGGYQDGFSPGEPNGGTGSTGVDNATWDVPALPAEGVTTDYNSPAPFPNGGVPQGDSSLIDIGGV